jgi:rRNA maturation endonuclease Nob1
MSLKLDDVNIFGFKRSKLMIKAGMIAEANMPLRCDECEARTEVQAGQEVPRCNNCGHDTYNSHPEVSDSE